MKRLALVVIPLVLAACGGGGDIQEAKDAQTYNISCTTAPASINCQATPNGAGSTSTTAPGNTGNTKTGGINNGSTTGPAS